MPYPNEHSARLIDPPSDYIRVRRTDGSGDGTVQGIKIPTTIAVIWYIVKKDGKEVPIAQALRFPTKNWTADKAKKWLKDNEIKYKSFEAAKDSDSLDNQSIEQERRVLGFDDVELRVEDGENPKIIGYAAKYGKWSLDLGGFVERIKDGAFDDAIKNCDIRALKNHDVNLLLGRTSSGTLKLESNTVGLHFEIDAPNTTTGKDLVEEIRRKDITGCSFSFTTEEQEWKYLSEGKPAERTIIKIGQLFDVGPVTFPAYPDTAVALRCIQEYCDLSKEDRQIGEEIKKLERQKQREIERKYQKARRIINRNKPA